MPTYLVSKEAYSMLP